MLPGEFNVIDEKSADGFNYARETTSRSIERTVAKVNGGEL